MHRGEVVERSSGSVSISADDSDIRAFFGQQAHGLAAHPARTAQHRDIAVRKTQIHPNFPVAER
ncbi:hypothetical protein [Sphingopyxis panaciterrulae]|uniref:Uncharacterized protein n=1 Tax=Sphingopyxis panaciterrulae TaxID=462372 RepID=A0A7W9ESS0_9SPHN|nr:hypothetical protein [Sphingopyxis panaciterrulae]MBB5707445.1 hypothetical protein [Sphingopyxis panaciterrulae]